MYVYLYTGTQVFLHRALLLPDDTDTSFLTRDTAADDVYQYREPDLNRCVTSACTSKRVEVIEIRRTQGSAYACTKGLVKHTSAAHAHRPSGDAAGDATAEQPVSLMSPGSRP